MRYVIMYRLQVPLIARLDYGFSVESDVGRIVSVYALKITVVLISESEIREALKRG